MTKNLDEIRLKNIFSKNFEKSIDFFQKICYNNNYKRDGELVVSETQPRHDTQAVQFRFLSVSLIGHGGTSRWVWLFGFDSRLWGKFQKEYWQIRKIVLYFKYSKGKELIKMLKMICVIPEEIGWAIVGFLGVFTLMMIAKVVKVFVEAVKERMEDEE